MYIYSSLLAYGNCKPLDYFSYCHIVLSESGAGAGAGAGAGKGTGAVVGAGQQCL